MKELAMVPTREKTIQSISEMTEMDYKKVAIYVRGLNQKNEVATATEVANLSKRFNQKYANTFRALAK